MLGGKGRGGGGGGSDGGEASGNSYSLTHARHPCFHCNQAFPSPFLRAWELAWVKGGHKILGSD